MLYYAVYEYFAVEGLGSLLDKVNTMSQDISTIPNIYFDDYTLEVVKNFAYLSFIISSNLSLKADPNPQIFNAVTMTSLNKWGLGHHHAVSQHKDEDVSVYSAGCFMTVRHEPCLPNKNTDSMPSICSPRRSLGITWQDCFKHECS